MADNNRFPPKGPTLSLPAPTHPASPAGSSHRCCCWTTQGTTGSRGDSIRRRNLEKTRRTGGEGNMPHVSDSETHLWLCTRLENMCIVFFKKFCGWLANFLYLFPSSISRRYTYYSSNHSNGSNSAAIAANLALKQQQQQQQRLRLRARKVLCSECRQVKKNK